MTERKPGDVDAERDGSSESLRVTLVDGSEHVVVHSGGVAAREALEELLAGRGGGWFYTGDRAWIRRDAVVRVVLENEG
jgi:hypothetical protein